MFLLESFYIFRFDRIWKEELKVKGLEKVLFVRILWKASRIRVIIGGLIFIIFMFFSFVVSVWVYFY